MVADAVGIMVGLERSVAGALHVHSELVSSLIWREELWYDPTGHPCMYTSVHFVPEESSRRKTVVRAVTSK